MLPWDNLQRIIYFMTIRNTEGRPLLFFKLKKFFISFVFGRSVACGILVSHQGSNLCHLQWKHSGALTTGQPGKRQDLFLTGISNVLWVFLFDYQLKVKWISFLDGRWVNYPGPTMPNWLLVTRLPSGVLHTVMCLFPSSEAEVFLATSVVLFFPELVTL